MGLIQTDYGGVVGCGLQFFVDCGRGSAGLWVVIVVVVAVGGLHGGRLSQ